MFFYSLTVTLEPFNHVKQPTQTRWLSHEQAVHSLRRCLSNVKLVCQQDWGRSKGGSQGAVDPTPPPPPSLQCFFFVLFINHTYKGVPGNKMCNIMSRKHRHLLTRSTCKTFLPLVKGIIVHFKYIKYIQTDHITSSYMIIHNYSVNQQAEPKVESRTFRTMNLAHKC